MSEDETLEETAARLRALARQMGDTLRLAGRESAAFQDRTSPLSDQLRPLWAEWVAEWGIATRRLENDIAEREAERRPTPLRA
jgi:hypothetical protein